MPLDDASRAEIYAAFDEIGYEMPSL